MKNTYYVFPTQRTYVYLSCLCSNTHSYLAYQYSPTYEAIFKHHVGKMNIDQQWKALIASR